ncbi:MAG: ABC transporter permease, partial [Bacteroidaceae bacterium]|nr:ABC transporter permease [Bacteroidaceae bacterium]
MKNHNQSQSPLHHTPLPCGGVRGRVRWVWGGLLANSLATAWRNLLKYKVQNVISIACLAVGVVCFAITVHIIFNFARNLYYSSIDQGRPVFTIYEMSEEEFKNTPKHDANGADRQLPMVNITKAFIDRLYSMKLPAMKEIHGIVLIMRSDFEFDDNTPQPKTYLATFAKCSPRRYHYLGYRSAITGERIAELNEGDVIITDDLRDKVFGKGVDPRGFRIFTEIDGSQRTIRDVVNVSERMEDFYNDAIIYCQKNYIAETQFNRINSLQIELAEGYTAQQLREQLAGALPEYYVALQWNAWDWTDEGLFYLTIIGVGLLLGSSVLLIGAVGFLKMQLQLFSLRAREMALRRTMGAKPRHLFMLLVTEMAIMFAFTAIATLLITVQLSRYALSTIQRLSDGILFDVGVIVETGMWICLATLLCSLVVAFISLYRQLHSPVGMRVGRSGHPRTKGQSVMLGTQFAISMMLTFAVLGAFYALNVIAEQEYGSHTENKTPYRKTLMARMTSVDHLVPDFANKIAQNKDVEHISKCIYACCESEGPEVDEGLITHTLKYKNTDGTIRVHAYSFLASDEELFDLLDIEISADKPKDENLQKHVSAIYVRTEEVERLREKWNLHISSDVQTRRLYKDRSYTLIGYAPALIDYRPGSHSTPSFWLVDSDVAWQDLTNAKELRAYSPKANYLIFPKDGKYGKVEDALTDLWREAQPGNMNDVPVDNLYEEWFKGIRMLELMRELCFLLVIVSILCIVASVYSAISLESRGRQKEVALRKIHGAHSWDIMRLFGRYYLRLLLISGIIVGILSIAFIIIFATFALDGIESKDWMMILFYLILAILIVVAVTLITISHKIWKVSKIQ